MLPGTEDDAARGLTARLRAGLAAALASRDVTAAAALRSALAAIGNVEAIGTADTITMASATASEHFAGALTGLGPGEAPRRQLTAAEVAGIVAAEIAERQSAARQYDRLGHADRAERLRREAGVLAGVLGDQSH